MSIQFASECVQWHNSLLFMSRHKNFTPTVEFKNYITMVGKVELEYYRGVAIKYTFPFSELII